MINREKALKFLNEQVGNENIIKHMLAVEALMAEIYDALKTKERTDLGGNREEWMMAGLLHDGDYKEGVPVEKMGIQITDWLREEGYEIPENVAHTMAAHNWGNTGVEPKSLMDWAIFCGDTLTGLIIATTLVRPDKKLASVEVKSVMKKFKQPAFAAGTRREEIALCEEKLGIPLRDFVEIGLQAMQGVATDLGL